MEPKPRLAPLPSSMPTAMEVWNKYEKDYEDWLVRCDEVDKENFRNPDPVLLRRFQTHSAYKGQTHLEVLLAFRRDARYAQMTHKLATTRPEPWTSLEKRAVVEITRTEWNIVSGGDWREMSADEVEKHIRGLRESTSNEWADMDHQVLAMNRMYYEIHRDVADEKYKNMSGFIRYKRQNELHPNETKVATLLRESRSYALALGVVALLIVWFVEPSYLTTVGVVVGIYLLLSYTVYPKLLVRRG